MTWADFFSSQIFGIIVGALITTGFTWFLDWRKSVREQKFRSIEKRNEAYFAVFDVFFGLLDTDFNGVGEVYDEHIVGKYEKTRAAVFMYGCIMPLSEQRLHVKTAISVLLKVIIWRC